MNIFIFILYTEQYIKLKTKMNEKIDPQNERTTAKLQAASNSHEIIWRKPLFSAGRIRPA